MKYIKMVKLPSALYGRFVLKVGFHHCKFLPTRKCRSVLISTVCTVTGLGLCHDLYRHLYINVVQLSKNDISLPRCRILEKNKKQKY